MSRPARRTILPNQNAEQEATSYALQLILAVGEESRPDLIRLTRDLGKRGDKFASLVMLGLMQFAANALKREDPELWATKLRLSLHDIDIDPAKWSAK